MSDYPDFKIRDVVIAGGGTAGWMAAAALSRFLGRSVNITLVESEQIGTVGVGEATIPQILRLIGMLGLDEAKIMRASQATFKLGIEFNDWGQIGESYLHTFGHTGINLSNLDFHHYWLRHRQAGGTDSLWDYSIHHKAAYQNRFAHLPQVGKSGLSGLAYAYHFDSGLFGQSLRDFAEGQGVTRVEGLIADVKLNAETGFIDGLKLEDGRQLAGDFFIDCTGFRGLLIGKALEVGYQDWSKYLPCDRAIAVGTDRSEPLLPYTKATAHKAGWQWRIPLQHRTGNGHVYCSAYISDDEALETLMANLDAPTNSEPKFLRFKTGRRDVFWEKNCAAFGLSGGFMEPLESTSIHLIQAQLSKLIEMFPTRAFSPAVTAEYNRQTTAEFDLIRDFLILHYHQTQRDDSEFWNYCRTMDIPDTLAAKMALFAESGIVQKAPEDIFQVASWVQVMTGQGIRPTRYHAMADRLSGDKLSEFFDNMRRIIDRTAGQLPDHGDYVARYCGAAQ